jgi:hypothetical protein
MWFPVTAVYTYVGPESHDDRGPKRSNGGTG